MQQQRQHSEAPTIGMVVDALSPRVDPIDVGRDGRLGIVPMPIGVHTLPEPQRPDTADEVPSDQLWQAAIRVTREAAALASELRRQVARETGPRAA